MNEDITPEEEFDELITRMENCGDLRILREYVERKIEGCTSKRHDPLIIENSLLLTSVNGEDYAWTDFKLDIKIALKN